MLKIFKMKAVFLLCILSLTAYCFVDAQARSKSVSGASKIQQLTEWTAKKSVIQLNVNTFKEFLRAPARDYSFVVMFTAMAPGRQCAICHQVYEEWQIVANSFRFSNAYHDKLYFGLVDFDDSFDVFQLLHLNSAPVIMHFPAKGKPKPADTMDLQRAGVHAEAIAKWIQERTDTQIRIFRPANYSGTIGFALLFVLIAGFLYLRRNNLEFLYNKQMWAISAISFCFAMVSGQMWNQIRGPPFYQRSKEGPVYINAGSHGQYIFESYIVMVLNCAVVVGLILMIEAAGGIKGPNASAKSEKEKQQNQLKDPRRRSFQAVVGLMLLCIFFSLLLSVFRSKTQGYPYSFLFK